MASWADAMDLVNEKLLSVFPDTLSIAGVSYECIAPPHEITAQMTQGPFDANRIATFQMRRSEFNASGLQVRHPFESNGATFELKNIKPDANDSIVTLFATLRQ